MPSPRYETTPFRAAVALPTGALAGSALIIGGVLGPMAFLKSDSGHLPGGDGGGLMALSQVAGISLIAFVLGMLVLAMPAWWVLHRAGRRTWLDAALLGVGLSLAVCAALSLLQFMGPGSLGPYTAFDAGGATVINGRLTPHGWAERGKGMAWVAFASAVAAVIVWRIAYRKPKPGG
jgi:hypothetical protein